MEKTERFYMKIQRNILEQDKALVSRGAANAVKHRPAEPFGWCCQRTVGAVLGAVNRVTSMNWGNKWCFSWCWRKNT